MVAPGLPLCLLAVLASTATIWAKCDGGHPDTMHLQNLRKSLLCRYEKDSGPTKNPKQKTSVKVRFLRTRMDIDENANTMTLFGYIMLVWTDEWLTWDPAQYQNTTRVYVDWQEIWTPKVALVESPTKVLGGSQALIMNGMVVWTLLTPTRAPCINDPTRWPNDKIVCNVSIGNLSPSTAVLEKTQVQLSLVRWKNKGWGMTRMMMKPFQAAGFQDGVLIQITAKRQSSLHEATVVMPYNGLVCLLLTSLWLPAHTPHRPLLLLSVILILVLLNTILPTLIGVVGTHAPAVLQLYRDTLLLSGAMLVQWLLAMWLLRFTPGQRPPWPVTYIADLADQAASPGGGRLARILLVLLSVSDTADNVDVPSMKTRTMAAIMDRAAFVILAVVFGGLAVRIIP